MKYYAPLIAILVISAALYYVAKRNAKATA